MKASGAEERADRICDLALRMLDKLCDSKRLISRDPILVSTTLEVAERLTNAKQA